MPLQEMFVPAQFFTLYFVPDEDGFWVHGLVCSVATAGGRGGRSDLGVDPCASVERMSPAHLVPDTPAGSCC